MENIDIKIIICCHYDTYVPKNDYFFPIQTGVANSTRRFENMQSDNEGDNISNKNDYYCELTAHYWAWKNIKSDFIGFFHHRRYLNFSEKIYQEDGWGNIVYDTLNENVLDDLSINTETLKKIIPQYDIIVPNGRIIPANEKNLYEQYCDGPGQHKEDLDLLIETIVKKHPEYEKVVQSYLYSNNAYECNMYIMRSDLFKQYAEFAFDILFEVEKHIDFEHYNVMESRVMGFLAERLFGIWFTFNKDKYRILELQKTFFKNTDKSIQEIQTDLNAVVSVLACNDYYVPYLAAMLESIVENATQQRKYEIFVLTTDISVKNQKILKNLVERDSRFYFQVVNVKNFFDSTSLFVHTHISVETYYRFFILKFFSNTKKVLYLDSDMVVNSDIAELFDIELGENYIAACSDIDLAGSIKIKGHEDQAAYVKNVIGVIGSTEYFQAGVLLFNVKKMLERASCEDLLKKALERNWNYMDQDILNNVFQKDILYLDQSWNVIMNWETDSDCRLNYLKNAPLNLYTQYLAARKNPKIIHYAGFQKPWDVPDCDFAEYFWKYARQTPFYEEILRRMTEHLKTSTVEKFIYEDKEDLKNIVRIYRRLKRTLFWRGLRKIYRFFRRQKA